MIGASGPLRAPRFTRDYWIDELKHVIKGRGLTHVDEYADLARVGRKHALPVEIRQAVWDLYEAYSTNLRSRGVSDFEDVVLLAKDAVRINRSTGTTPSSWTRRRTCRARWSRCCTLWSATDPTASP